jgi:hypothetical protein
MTATSERHGSSIRSLDAAGLLRAQVAEAHRQLDDGFTDWLRSFGPAAPPAGARAVQLYLHAATVEDLTIHSLLRQVAPIFEKDWARRGPAHYSTEDLAPLRAYAQQVFAATDAYLATLTADDTSRIIDLSRLGQGRLSVAWVVSKFVVLQLAQIYGELMSAVQHDP